ncbi:MAG: SUMF1/EgtB/PvdO family nonheme iron enzyme [Rikenellaceae bacterium]
MNKLILSLLSALLTIGVTTAQTLPQDISKARAELNSSRVQYRSQLVKHGEAPEKLSVDVSGWQTVSLHSWGSENGTSYDQSAWGEGYFTKKSGERVRLSDMKFSYANTRYGTPKRDTGFDGGDIIMNGKKYEHGVAMHAEAEIIIELNGEYTNFEAEVGIEDSSREPGSVIFIVQNMSPRSVVEKLTVNYPTQMLALVTYGKIDPEKWMESEDGEYEKIAAQNAIKSLKDKSFYTAELDSVEGDTPQQRVAKYIEIMSDIQSIMDIENRLKYINITNIKRAFDDMKSYEGYDIARYQTKLDELETLLSQKLNLFIGDKGQISKAEKILSLSREILLSNKALDNNRIVVSRYNLGSQARSGMAPLMGTQPNNWSNQMSAVRVGFDAEIAEMTNIRDAKPSFSRIYKPEIDAPVTDLMLHWDSDKLLFTSINDRGLWDVFEMGIDGSNLHEVINNDEPDLEFTDGTFLPNGKYMATSNIGYNAVPCVHGTDPVGNMVLFDPADNSMRRLTFDQDANWNPVVANNGKVMYVRWEYTDLTHYFSRITMHMNPDGTEQKSLYGSGAFFPTSTFDIQPLPGEGSAFIGIASGHHGVARSGRLMIFDPAKSRDRFEGIVQEIPFSTRQIKPIIKDGMVNGVWPQFIKPRPVTDKYFLVTAKLTQQSLWGLYLVDIYDNMTLIAESEGDGFINGIYVQKRETPPVIPDKVDLSSKESTVYIQDIYEGEGLPGVPYGTVKKLRVFAYEYVYIRSPSNHVAQGIQSGWDIKRLLGEVDVNDDGSVIFNIPANTPISLQPMDSEGRALQWMRSWLTGMPGEVVSCVGCHEDQNTIAIPKSNLASKQTPQPIVSWEGGSRPFTYKLEVQPILDRACVACHNQDSKLDFRGGIYDPGIAPGTKSFINSENPFSTSYLNLHPYVNRQGPEADIVVMAPYEYHASTSELIRMLKNGHKGVTLTDKEWRTLYAWIDLNAPYHSNAVHNELNGYNQLERRQELACKYNNLDVNWQKEIDDYAKLLASKGEIKAEMPEEHKTPKYKSAKAKGWPFDSITAKEMQDDLGETTKEIDLGGGVKMTFRKIPAGQFVMGNNSGASESAPEWRVNIDKPFWIGEVEVTNEQYNALVPEHDSRYMGELWKDHVTPGAPANQPQQPVIRVSYNDIMKFCEELSAKSGLKITLPTEAQWEWVARAGSASDFWFGDMNADYGKYENMADVTLEKMAFRGNRKSEYFRYYNYLPKDEAINDGSLFQVAVKSYDANAWGIYDMLGNVRELTRSDYQPYPYKTNDGVDSADKVVRGGSWTDRSKFSTSYSRKSVAPWQPANNVGFRLIIEE